MVLFLGLHVWVRSWAEPVYLSGPEEGILAPRFVSLDRDGQERTEFAAPDDSPALALFIRRPIAEDLAYAEELQAALADEPARALLVLWPPLVDVPEFRERAADLGAVVDRDGAAFLKYNARVHPTLVAVTSRGLVRRSWTPPLPSPEEALAMLRE